jgi:hypothetical protein
MQSHGPCRRCLPGPSTHRVAQQSAGPSCPRRRRLAQPVAARPKSPMQPPGLPGRRIDLAHAGPRSRRIKGWQLRLETLTASSFSRAAQPGRRRPPPAGSSAARVGRPIHRKLPPPCRGRHRCAQDASPAGSALSRAARVRRAPRFAAPRHHEVDPPTAAFQPSPVPCRSRIEEGGR